MPNLRVKEPLERTRTARAGLLFQQWSLNTSLLLKMGLQIPPNPSRAPAAAQAGVPTSAASLGRSGWFVAFQAHPCAFISVCSTEIALDRKGEPFSSPWLGSVFECPPWLSLGQSLLSPKHQEGPKPRSQRHPTGCEQGKSPQTSGRLCPKQAAAVPLQGGHLPRALPPPQSPREALAEPKQTKSSNRASSRPWERGGAGWSLNLRGWALPAQWALITSHFCTRALPCRFPTLPRG